MNLFTVLAFVLMVTYVTSTGETYEGHWDFNGCHLENTASQDTYAKAQSITSDASYLKKEVWALIFVYWDKFKKNRAISEKFQIFEGECSGNTYRKCRTCADADSIEDCIVNGKTEMCSAGQDACVVEKVLGKYYRRCGHMCECKPNVPFGYEGNDWVQLQLCQRAGCGAVYGCAAVGCYNETELILPYHDMPPPNSAFDSDGSLCRCDPECNNMAGASAAERCCPDVCAKCGMLPEYMANQCMNGADK